MCSSLPLRATVLIILGLSASTGFLPLKAVATPEAGASTPRPLMQLADTRKDGGTVEQGTVVQYQFILHNRGQADLEIPRVKPTCGCSVAKWDRVVKPGATSVIEAQMDTEHFRGPVSKHLTVLSNDPDRPQIDLTISARVVPLVWIKPGSAAVISVASLPVTQAFVLERNGGRPMKIVQLLPGAPYVTAEATPLPGVGRFQVKVTAAPDAPLGRSIVPVTLKTDLEKAPTLTLLVTVDKGIVAEPPVVFYGLLPAEIKAPVQAAVTLTRHTSPFHIKSLSADEPQLTPRLETIQEGSDYRVTVTYTGGWITGLKRAVLTVTTDDPVQSTIRIPIQAVIQTKLSNLPTAVVH